MIKLVKDWREILKKAWSVRLMIAAALLTGLEAVVPFFAVPKIFVFLLVAGALVARIMAQKDLK
jgi:hypothetical protein